MIFFFFFVLSGREEVCEHVSGSKCSVNVKVNTMALIL